MKNLFAAAILFILLPSAIKSQEYNKTCIDSKTQNVILTGLCNRYGLVTGDFGVSFSTEYSNYNPDTLTINKLKYTIVNNSVTIVLGTWCGDSKEQVPRFYKVLNASGFDCNDIKLISVNRDKKAEGLNIDSLNITHVPTIIIYNGEKEQGRIIEVPKTSLEKDLLEIVSKKD